VRLANRFAAEPASGRSSERRAIREQKEEWTVSMDTSFTLWDCPPLKARITGRQCAANRARCEEGPRSSQGASRDILETSWHAGRPECTACQGVAWWAKQTGREPQVLFTSQVVESLEKKDALRRRMSGADKPVPPGAMERRRRRTATLRRAG
jgi:hypothetical protein